MPLAAYPPGPTRPGEASPCPGKIRPFPNEQQSPLRCVLQDVQSAPFPARLCLFDMILPPTGDDFNRPRSLALSHQVTKKGIRISMAADPETHERLTAARSLHRISPALTRWKPRVGIAAAKADPRSWGASHRFRCHSATTRVGSSVTANRYGEIGSCFGGSLSLRRSPGCC